MSLVTNFIVNKGYIAKNEKYEINGPNSYYLSYFPLINLSNYTTSLRLLFDAKTLKIRLLKRPDKLNGCSVWFIFGSKAGADHRLGIIVNMRLGRSSLKWMNSSFIRKDCFQNKSKFITEDHFTKHMNITIKSK